MNPPRGRGSRRTPTRFTWYQLRSCHSNSSRKIKNSFFPSSARRTNIFLATWAHLNCFFASPSPSLRLTSSFFHSRIRILTSWSRNRRRKVKGFITLNFPFFFLLETFLWEPPKGAACRISELQSQPHRTRAQLNSHETRNDIFLTIF